LDFYDVLGHKWLLWVLVIDGICKGKRNELALLYRIVITGKGGE
jgi:hypothetical protein